MFNHFVTFRHHRWLQKPLVLKEIVQKNLGSLSKLGYSTRDEITADLLEIFGNNPPDYKMANLKDVQTPVKSYMESTEPIQFGQTFQVLPGLFPLINPAS
jgi:hypothetical protein